MLLLFLTIRVAEWEKLFIWFIVSVFREHFLIFVCVLLALLVLRMGCEM